MGKFFRSVWSLPVLPLYLFAALVWANWAFDWCFVRHDLEPPVPISSFSWADPVTNPAAATNLVGSVVAIEALMLARFASLVILVIASCVLIYQSQADIVNTTTPVMWVVAVFVAVLAYGLCWCDWSHFVANPWTNETLWNRFIARVKEVPGQKAVGDSLKVWMTAATHYGLILAALAASCSRVGRKHIGLEWILLPALTLAVLHGWSLGLWQLRTEALLTDPAQVAAVDGLLKWEACNAIICYVMLVLGSFLPTFTDWYPHYEKL